MREVRAQLSPVFYVAAAIALAFVLWGVLGTKSLASATKAARDFVVFDFGWLYLIAVTLFLVFVLFLAFSRFGRIKLGKDDDEPEFGRFSWFAMLYQAGMGIGIVFWGVAEPISHFSEPPYGLAAPGSTRAADVALQYSFFHWALHPWAVYAAIGLAIAYFNFRRDKPGLVSAVFTPLLGDRVNGPLGKAIDVMAIIATLFGVAVSLGLGTLQINSGLSFLFGLPNDSTSQIVIIAVTTAVFMASAATGIQRGIKWLSNASIVLAGLLVVLLLVLGPTVLQLSVFAQGTGGYFGDLIPMSFRTNAFASDPWAGDWTFFYWATWIAWSPYVGSFIARISKGRTIREFVAGVLLVPSLVTFLWFAVLGAAAIDLDRKIGGVISRAVAGDEAVGAFVFLTEYPLGFVMSLIVLMLVFVFFVAGADSASIVLGRMSARGILNPKAAVKLVWGAIMGAFAAILLLAGGLDALQDASIVAALPFVVILLALCWALSRALMEERREERGGARERGGAPAPAPAQAAGS